MLLDVAARVVLLPVLIGQAVYLRKTFLLLPEPDGPRSGMAGDGPPLRMLIIGDSSAVGIGVATQDLALSGQITQRLAPNRQVTFDLIAKSGARTADALAWLEAAPKASYDVVVTALGVNDVTKGVSLRSWLQLQAQLFDTLGDRFGARRIIVSGLPPVGQFPLLPHPLRWILGRQAVRFDRNLRALVAQRPDCVAVTFEVTLDKTNMAADGFHPGPTVYAAWAEAIVQLIVTDPLLLDGPHASP